MRRGCHLDRFPANYQNQLAAGAVLIKAKPFVHCLVLLQIVNLQFSKFLQIWLSGHSENGVSTQVGDLLFSGQFGQTQIGDLASCPEIVTSRET